MQGSGGSFAQTGQAMRLLESVAVALQQREPALLVGETGTGKTTLVQRLADQVGHCCCSTRVRCSVQPELLWCTAPLYHFKCLSVNALSEG